jgi:hypothetical protein
LRRSYNVQEIDGVRRQLGQYKDLAHSAAALLPRIRELVALGWGVCAIGRELGLSHKAVSRALGRRK